MARWKELGEVPDSDEDESAFDGSEESEHESPRADAGPQDEFLVENLPNKNEPIWDIPSSSSPSSSQAPRERIDADPGHSQPYELSGAQYVPRHLDPLLPLSSPGDGTYDNLRGPMRATERVLEGLEGSEASRSPPIDSHTLKPPVKASPESVNIPDDDEESVIRYGRSLRPRKPIQEHPYLLESAQYSKTLRSHGVRPLRLQAEEVAGRRRDDDSQDQEYEGDSQSTIQGFIQEDLGESQGSRHPGPFKNVDKDEPKLIGIRPRSLQRESIQQPEISLRSSQEDEDEFPDPADISKWESRNKPIVVSKGRASPKSPRKQRTSKLYQSISGERERPYLADDNNIFDIPSSAPRNSPNLLVASPSTATECARVITGFIPKPGDLIAPRDQSPIPAKHSTSILDLTSVVSQSQASSERDDNSHGGSESETRMVQAAMRRIRGVLPASWLRLDQQSTPVKNTKANLQGSPDHSTDQTQRKGVAQRRQTSAKPATDIALFLDDSDNDETTLRHNEASGDRANAEHDISIFEDDVGSVVEDDHTDNMLLRHKRSTVESDMLERPRKQRKRHYATLEDETVQPKRQQRIKRQLNRSRGTCADFSSESDRGKSNPGVKPPTQECSRATKPSRPPRLSILDVVEPDAPPFIRIAARTANRRSDRGRSSPTRKHIALGTRQDNIDASSVLRDWKRGRIRPRTYSRTAVTSRSYSYRPLHPQTHSHTAQPAMSLSKMPLYHIPSSSRFLQPRRMSKQTSIRDFVEIKTGTITTPTRPIDDISLSNHVHNVASRPAQLETADEKVGRHAFHAQKRALDALYRKSRRSLHTLEELQLEQPVGGNGSPRSFPRHNEPSVGNTASPNPTTSTRGRSRFRKGFRPTHVDTAAPQYTHANDPLPREIRPMSPVESTNSAEAGVKLSGLGPFGTHYTQHFEIFPLDLGAFLHESTLLGSGRLVKALNGKTGENLYHPRGRQTFVLDKKVLRWGLWEAQTSSELGIVFDWIADYLHSDSPDPQNGTVLVEATEFVLNYLQSSISFSDQESERHFVGRSLEILQSFVHRLESLPPLPHYRTRPLIDVLSRCLIILTQLLHICRDPDQLSQRLQVEGVLRNIAERTARKLLETELIDIRSLYYELRRIPFRERGIRDEQHSMICWVVLIRVLEEARIPKAGFWDVVSSVMLERVPGPVSDAHTLEQIWYNFFTLLPLGEFDNAGVVVPGIRHTSPLEGWILPQRLLRCIFQLYESNSRQAPSFNDYCRGMISRCHYLVEQWGWRKSNGVIGTIFDFFASRGLSNLRNEEVYRSPEFLERLTGSPSLAILSEDRCFHIFLKLLALSIQRLTSYGLTKDVKNMVARVLPNHNRQYSKEDDIHETELAALRNHHDLLCTLFWAAPPGLRPSVQTIEKLVVPGSSHKEACLISLRAWSQLARFAISSDDDIVSYKPFADWQKNVFQQVMEQYLSAESDVQQQLSRMPKATSKGINRDVINTVIQSNKKGAMDILRFSMKGFLDVIRSSRTLAAVSFAVNHYQLDQVFTRFPFSSTSFDWSSLRPALDILDYYVSRIEGFLKQPPENPEYSWHGEDAIMLIDRKIAPPFFSMLSVIAEMKFKEEELGPVSGRAVCMEQAVVIAGRQAARLIHSRLSRVSQFFLAGKYSIFPGAKEAASSFSRRYRALFLAMLIEHGVDDFKDLGRTVIDLLMVELAKPLHLLAYENQLALAIQTRGNPLLKDSVIGNGDSPDYNSNKGLFSHVVAVMRRTLRFAETSRRSLLQSQFTKALKITMEQMKLDLKSMPLGSPEHASYIEFVRSIITMIRSQDLCPVDSYFYQISREYSPSSQDPRLQIASILSWGLKLEEGDTKAVPGLFYLLFPNFKLALANGKLVDEKSILQQGMSHHHVLSFMLGRMLPAIINTALGAPDAWVLLDTYVGAFSAQLAATCIHRAIGSEDAEGLLVLLQFTLVGLQQLRALNATEFRPEHLYSLLQVMTLLNLLSPSLAAYLINEPAPRAAGDIVHVMEALTDFARVAGKYVSSILHRPKHWMALDTEQSLVDPSSLFEGVQTSEIVILSDPREHINKFAKHMVRDIDDNWVSDRSTITIRGPCRTQYGQRTQIPRWDVKKLLRMLYEQLQGWNYVHDSTVARGATLPSNEFSFYW
ncbi:Mus7/MMS22 family-domain-containing protein [Durotheca rogersii]|uniref:Mus7/MMS22 family-domain-containing protein n=1 Tax=Durotheca rogersii TaxID=419775 RepID=UPI00221EBD7F|nr:Mus7/MMS22 family-domain-containing protein [Durotheca rogersii]KAI5858164.1 Mus7/MMS22 family-domain-containing protein [Durotheca rogersii]